MFAARFSNGRSAFYNTEVVMIPTIDALLARMVRLDGPAWTLHPVGNGVVIAESDDASVVISAQSGIAKRQLAEVTDSADYFGMLVTNSDLVNDEDDFILVTCSKMKDIPVS